MKRVFLLVLTNVAIMLVLSVVAHLLGIDRYLAARNQNMTGLLIVSAFLGFGGAFISLAISKWMAKRSMGVEVITQPRNADEQWLLNTVKSQADLAGIRMPEVGIFDSPQPNAFATGARRNAALVAVSTGLLRSMRRNEVEAVLGHEIAHVANGDMVTLTLIQGVVNTFVFFLSRVVGSIVDSAMRRGDGRDSGPGPAYFITSMIAQLVLGVLATMIVMWFSRWREFRADRGGARAAGAGNMIAALERLRASAGQPLPSQFAAFGIEGGARSGLARLFMSHPPLEERIAALQKQV